MTAALAHFIRLTIRIHAGQFHKEADLALPLSSSVGEVLAEITELLGAPQPASAWQATTASGRIIDVTTALSAAPLEDGDILVLTPRRTLPSPVVRDAAESLAASAHGGRTSAIPMVWAWAGLGALTCLVWVLGPPVLALAGLSAGAYLLALWTRHASLVHLALAAAVAAGWEAISPSLADAPFAALTSSLTGAMALLACHVAGLSGMRTTAATGTALFLLAVGGVGFFLPGASHPGSPGTAAAACVLLTGLAVLALAPLTTIKAVALKVPQLPTAGQDLAVADSLQPDVDDRARRAGLAYEGVCVGLALAMLPALGFMHLSGVAASTEAPLAELFGTRLAGAGFAQALCVAVAASMVLHAARQGRVLAQWALMSVGLGASLAACLCAAQALRADEPDTGAWVMAAVAGLLIAAMSSAPIWAKRVPRLEPTTISWFEKVETLATAAALPLAMHLAGVFVLIRGLG